MYNTGIELPKVGFSSIDYTVIPAGSYFTGFNLDNSGKLSKIDCNGVITIIEGGGSSIIIEGSGLGSTQRCGSTNSASGDYSTVSGGYSNESSGDNATIGGGNCNVASCENSSIVYVLPIDLLHLLQIGSKLLISVAPPLLSGTL